MEINQSTAGVDATPRTRTLRSLAPLFEQLASLDGDSSSLERFLERRGEAEEKRRQGAHGRERTTEAVIALVDQQQQTLSQLKTNEAQRPSTMLVQDERRRAFRDAMSAAAQHRQTADTRGDSQRTAQSTERPDSSSNQRNDAARQASADKPVKSSASPQAPSKGDTPGTAEQKGATQASPKDSSKSAAAAASKAEPNTKPSGPASTLANKPAVTSSVNESRGTQTSPTPQQANAAGKPSHQTAPDSAGQPQAAKVSAQSKPAATPQPAQNPDGQARPAGSVAKSEAAPVAKQAGEATLPKQPVNQAQATPQQQNATGESSRSLSLDPNNASNVPAAVGSATANAAAQQSVQNAKPAGQTGSVQPVDAARGVQKAAVTRGVAGPPAPDANQPRVVPTAERGNAQSTANATRMASTARNTDQAGKNDANVERLLRFVSRHRGDSKTTATMRLEPAELGKIRIKMDWQGSRLTLRISAENDVAQRLLNQDVDALRRGLQAAGIQLERAEVRPMTQSDPQPVSQQQFQHTSTGDGQTNSSQTSAEQSDHGPAGAGRRRDENEAANSMEESEAPAEPELVTESLVNIIA